MACAITEGITRDPIALVRNLAGGCHQSGFDHGWRPIWVQLHDQSRDSRDVRAGHGSAAVEVKAAAVVAGRRNGGQNIHAGGHDVWLEQIAAAYAASQPAGTQVYTIALGDAPNDAAMLDAADRGFIIANPHGTPMPELAGEAVDWITRSTLPGPAGWSESVLQALQEINTLTDAGMTRG